MIRTHTLPHADVSATHIDFKPYGKYFFFFFRFDITDGPRYGRVERLRGNGRWSGTKRFYSRQLERDKVNGLIRCGKSMHLNLFLFLSKVRYLHTRGSPSKDSFHFTASVEGGGAGGEDGGGQEGSTFLTKVKIFSHFPQFDRKKCTIYFFQDLPLHKFDLRFVTLQVRALRNQPARIVNLRETLITDAYLLYQVRLDQIGEKRAVLSN